MQLHEVSTHIESLGHVLTLRPHPGDGSPTLAWGDLFFYYAPDGVLPPGQPFATITTKDYPDEPPWTRGEAGVYRVNVDAGRSGAAPEHLAPAPHEAGVRDRVLAHPSYAAAGWVCVIDPGNRSWEQLRDLLRGAHAGAARRWHRRHDATDPREG